MATVLEHFVQKSADLAWRSSKHVAANFAGPESPFLNETHADSEAITEVAFVRKQMRAFSVILGVIAHPELRPAHA